jgi:hypothetical protein
MKQNQVFEIPDYLQKMVEPTNGSEIKQNKAFTRRPKTKRVQHEILSLDLKNSGICKPQKKSKICNA